MSTKEFLDYFKCFFGICLLFLLLFFFLLLVKYNDILCSLVLGNQFILSHDIDIHSCSYKMCTDIILTPVHLCSNKKTII